MELDFDGLDQENLQPCSAKLMLNPAQVSPGEEFEAVLTLRLEPSWYLYAEVPDDAPYTAAEFSLLPAEGIEPLGDWVRPPAETYDQGDKIKIYRGEATLRRRLRVGGAKGVTTVRVRISFQACSPETCLGPEEMEVSAVLRVGESE